MGGRGRQGAASAALSPSRPCHRRARMTAQRGVPVFAQAVVVNLPPGREITGGFFIPAQVYPTNPQRSRQHIPREQPRAGTGAPADCGARPLPVAPAARPPMRQSPRPAGIPGSASAPKRTSGLRRCNTGRKGTVGRAQAILRTTLISGQWPGSGSVPTCPGKRPSPLAEFSG